MKNLEDIKVAIVCDWLTGIGGAERVVLELHHLFPNAPIYTSQYDPAKIDWFTGADVRTTWLQKLPKGLKKFLPVLRALSFSHLDLSEYDLVISSSGAEAKGVKIGKNTLHIAYIHAPTHYYWSRYEDYLKSPGFGAFNWLARMSLKILVGPLRKWDLRAAQKPQYLIANSSHTQSEILKYYKRESIVVHPPVDTERFNPQPPVSSPRSGFVIAGRQTPYKKIDLAVMACTQINVPLTVIGGGPDHAQLIKIAGPSISFIQTATDAEVSQYFQKASGFIFPGVDDFGIVAVEALAAGTPVVAYKAGGAIDYIIEGKTGIFFTEQTVDSLCKTLNSFNTATYDHSMIAQHAQQFSVEQFKNNMTSIIERVMV